MRDVDFWTVEERMVTMIEADVYPLSVAASGRYLLSFSVIVPKNENWMMIAASSGIDIPSGLITVPKALITILRQGRTVTLPAQITNLVATLPGTLIQSYASLFLSGVSAQGGDVISITMIAQNVDAGAPHDVESGNGQVLVIPQRMVPSVAQSQIVEERARLGVS